jgi:cytochrome b561
MTCRPLICRFHLHRIFNIVGLALATIGIAVAWSQFDSLPSTDLHKVLGVTVMVLGWFQPVNAFLRPHTHDASAGEKRTLVRFAWELLHKVIGSGTISLGIVVIFLGLNRGLKFQVVESYRWRNVFIAVGVALALLWVALMAIGVVHGRRSHQHRPGNAQNSAATLGVEMETSNTHPRGEPHNRRNVNADPLYRERRSDPLEVVTTTTP